MKIIFRKNDSTTSALLFIYNLLLTETSQTSLKLSSLLEIMKAFDKNETAIRMALSRAAKAGLIENKRQENEISYSLTSQGERAILFWNYGATNFWKRFQLRNSTWDEKWYFVITYTKTGNKDNIAMFLERLSQLGFALLNTNTWISPHYQPVEVKKLAGEFNIQKDIIEIYGELMLHQDFNKFLNETFALNNLAGPYQNFTDVYKKKFDETMQIYKEEWFIEKGSALPLLHELGWTFYNIASEDVVLPKQLNPDWIGEKAALIMKQFREILLYSVLKYLEKFE